MAGCILIGGHAVTIHHGTGLVGADLTIRSSDVEIGFDADDDGNLNVTFSSINTMGSDLLRVIPPPTDGG